MRPVSDDLLSRPLTAQLTARALCGTVPSASVVWAWDALSRLTGETAGGRSLAYAYDGAGDRTGIAWPDSGANALSATYAFDTLQRVTAITANGSQIAAYAYDSLGRRSGITRAGGAGAGTSYAYDGADRISSLVQSLAGGAAVTFTLSYDPASGLVSRGASNSAYTWHPGTASTAYAANGLNQYATLAPGGASAYDADGNTTLDASSATTFGYDLENRLTSANAPTAVTLAYDASGRLQTKTAGGAADTFLYAGAMLVGEYNGSGTILARYIPGPASDEAALWYAGPGTATPQWLHADAQGSTIAWSNGSGASLGTLAYDPYGQPSAWSGPRFAYTGQLSIAEAHLYDDKARAYSPALGRFLQTDPAGLAGGVNLYAYVGNDPVNGIDPSGMTEAKDTAPVTCVGAAVCPASANNTGAPTCDSVDSCLSGSVLSGVTVTAHCYSCWGGFSGLGFGGGAAFGGSGEGSGDNPLLRKLVKFVCSAVPSGRFVGVSGSLGGIGSTVAGGEIVQNFNSGQVSAFGLGGFQAGWNGGASVSVFGGFIWGNLAANNSNYAGGFRGANASVGVVAGSVASSGALSTAAAGLGASITNGTGNASATLYTRPLQLGHSIPLDPLGQALALANQACR